MMIDRTLLKRVASHGNCLYPGVLVDDPMIAYWEEQIGLKFPESYKAWLREFGNMGPVCIKGISGYELADAVRDTEKYRKENHLPEKYLAVKKCREIDPQVREWVYCLDTGRMEGGECPVVEFDFGEQKAKEYCANFDVFMQDMLEKHYERLVGQGRIRLEEEKEELVTGMDYRSCFMTARGSSQEKIYSLTKLTAEFMPPDFPPVLGLNMYFHISTPADQTTELSLRAVGKFAL